MLSFYNYTDKFFLTTNTKVLSSTLKEQKSLVRANRKKELLNMLIKHVAPRFSLPHYFLVRNPYHRVESFFKEKLRSKVLLATHQLDPYKLKLHQQIFYPYAKVLESDSIEVKQSKLLAFSWMQFIDALPYTYGKDEHLRPQSDSLRPRIKRRFPFPFKFERVFKIEDDNDMHYLVNNLNLDLSIRKNESPQNDEIVWNEGALKQVNRLYQQDFENFGYEVRVS